MALDLMEMERRLIGFDTVSRNSNVPMMDYVADVLKQMGLDVQAFPSPDGKKVNLFATLGPRDVGGLMLAGHTDTVPVEGQAWDTDPFTLTERDGKFFGRGTADMKSFIVQAILAAEALRGRKLKLPLHLAFTYDEEVGCHGAAHLMKSLAARKVALPKCAVIGEPTNFQVFNKHKGFSACRVSIRGVEGHSSLPTKGANAIRQAALVIQKLMDVEQERMGHRSLEADFELPYTTVNVGMISGGTATNIIANRCDIHFEYRTMPGEDPAYVINQVRGYVKEVLLPAFQRQQPNVTIEVVEENRGLPMLAPPGSAIEALALELTGQSRTGAAPYYTEGAIYNENGIPTVVCGPGDIDQAHRPNEFITREQLHKGTPFLGRLIERVCLT
jgi:acetylornithine deacetylase